MPAKKGAARINWTKYSKMRLAIFILWEYFTDSTGPQKAEAFNTVFKVQLKACGFGDEGVAKENYEKICSQYRESKKPENKHIWDEIRSFADAEGEIEIIFITLYTALETVMRDLGHPGPTKDTVDDDEDGDDDGDDEEEDRGAQEKQNKTFLDLNFEGAPGGGGDA